MDTGVISVIADVGKIKAIFSINYNITSYICNSHVLKQCQPDITLFFSTIVFVYPSISLFNSRVVILVIVYIYMFSNMQKIYFEETW